MLPLVSPSGLLRGGDGERPVVRGCADEEERGPLAIFFSEPCAALSGVDEKKVRHENYSLLQGVFEFSRHGARAQSRYHRVLWLPSICRFPSGYTSVLAPRLRAMGANRLRVRTKRFDTGRAPLAAKR